jgi:hypothetical protein
MQKKADRAIAVGTLVQPSKLAQFRQQFLALRYGAGVVHLGKTDDTLFVKHISRALVETFFFVQHAVGLAHCRVRPIIRQQWKGQAAQLLGPRLETGNGVGTDLQNFDIQLLEFFVVLTEPGYLIFSSTGKSKRQK